MLTNQYGFSANAVTVTQVVANLGAMTGGTVIGYLSQMFGRRFSIIFASIVGGALIYPYGFIGSKSVIAPAFFEQAMVQGVRKHTLTMVTIRANTISVCSSLHSLRQYFHIEREKHQYPDKEQNSLTKL